MILFAFLLSCFSGFPAPSPALADDLGDVLRREVIPVWEQSVKTIRDGVIISDANGTFEVKMQDGEYFLLKSDEMTFAANKKYSFGVQFTEVGKYRLLGVNNEMTGEIDSSNVFDAIQSARVGYESLPVFFGGFPAGGPFTFIDAINAEGFVIENAKRSIRDQEPCYEFTWSYDYSSAVKGEPHIPGSGTFWVSESSMCLLGYEWQYTSEATTKVCGRYSDYLKVGDGLLPGSVSYYRQDASGSIYDEYSLQLKWEKGSPDSREFFLKNYGLPEPEWAKADRSYIWVSFIALTMVGMFVYFSKVSSKK